MCYNNEKYGEKKTLNILFVADVSIHNIIGGAERVLWEQTTRLARRGHQVHILTRRLPTHAADHGHIHNVQEWRYDVNNSNDITFLVSSITHCQKLFKEISKKTSFELINFHQPFSAFAVNLLYESKNIPKVYTCHSLSFEEYQTRHANNSLLKAPFFHLNVILRKCLEKFSLAQSQKIIVLSGFTRDKLMNAHNVPREKIMIIPGAADLEYFRPPPDHTPPDPSVLFTVRNLVPRMGLENLVKAMSFLQKKGASLKLIIGGDGELKERLQQLIQELNLQSIVTLCGFLSKENLLRHYQTAGFFILPTVALEGFGLVTVEAMACGTPVLGTPIGGTKEILNKFDPGFLFKDTSPESMAELIWEKHKYYRDRGQAYQELRQKCRKFVVENYSWDINIKQTEKVFRECAGSAGK